MKIKNKQLQHSTKTYSFNLKNTKVKTSNVKVEQNN